MAAAARLVLALLAFALVATTASSAPAAPAAPSGLKAFLFRADEPLRREFARTPSFAWSPVAGALRYEFELATSDSFRENGVVFAARDLKSPVTSVELTLPWITGSPYSLFARVRAVTRAGVGSWSAPFGFNMRSSIVPRPMTSHPGLLRWTPVDGANAYEVWLIDANKHHTVYGNVLDQREFYTFHQSDPWVEKIRWRIRTLRGDVVGTGAGRANGLPAHRAGPWSPVYESTNPSFEVGQIRLVATVSDVIARGGPDDAAHRLMPAFTWAGNEDLTGKEAELFRIYVFTDSDCINRVFTGSPVGSPAFAGRSYGPLSLPRDSASLTTARGKYLADGDTGVTYGYDDEPLEETESLPAPKPTTGLPAAAPAPTAPATGGENGSSTPAPAPTSSSVPFLTVSGDEGAPVDLWDVDWPQAGYYWTVVAVDATAPNSISTAVTTPAAIGDTRVSVASAGGFATGDVITVGNATNQETVTVTGIEGDILTLATALKQGHGATEPVSRTSGNLTYRDRELPQEVCAAGRVMRFGKSSEPTLVSSGTPFASGLSPRGRTIAATGATPQFYGSPLVAWTPALGAEAYHVQWSKQRSPFVPSVTTTGSSGTAGVLTWASSAVLPLAPGNWWYRVRGINFGLPQNAQFMGWSEPTRLVVTRPTFALAPPKKPAKPTTKKP